MSRGKGEVPYVGCGATWCATQIKILAALVHVIQVHLKVVFVTNAMMQIYILYDEW